MFTMAFQISGATAEKVATIVKLDTDGGKATEVGLPATLKLGTQLIVQNNGAVDAQWVMLPIKGGTAAQAASQGGLVIKSSGSLAIDVPRSRPLDLNQAWIIGSAGLSMSLSYCAK